MVRSASRGIADAAEARVDRFGGGDRRRTLDELIALDTEVRAWAEAAHAVRSRTLVACMQSLISIVLVLAILVVLVVIHEFGHFVVARRARVRVHEFGIGFPPRALILGKDKETVYTLNWLPIGGFVRLEGEEGESDDPRAFVERAARSVC